MGIVKDGAVSGRFPSEKAFVVHYPAYPSSISRAIETLGGADAIAHDPEMEDVKELINLQQTAILAIKARSSNLNKLEFRFRPEDPYSHPTFGQLYPCNNLLLRISRKECRDEQNEDAVTAESNYYKESNPKIGEEDEVHLARDQESAPLKVKDPTPDDMQDCLTADIVAQVRESYEFKG
ncbi:hypothetical protein Dimus_000525 [Dionaea muscipula]